MAKSGYFTPYKPPALVLFWGLRTISQTQLVKKTTYALFTLHRVNSDTEIANILTHLISDESDKSQKKTSYDGGSCINKLIFH